MEKNNKRLPLPSFVKPFPGFLLFLASRILIVDVTLQQFPLFKGCIPFLCIVFPVPVSIMSLLASSSFETTPPCLLLVPYATMNISLWGQGW